MTRINDPFMKYTENDIGVCNNNKNYSNVTTG